MENSLDISIGEPSDIDAVHTNQELRIKNYYTYLARKERIRCIKLCTGRLFRCIGDIRLFKEMIAEQPFIIFGGVRHTHTDHVHRCQTSIIQLESGGVRAHMKDIMHTTLPTQGSSSAFEIFFEWDRKLPHNELHQHIGNANINISELTLGGIFCKNTLFEIIVRCADIKFCRSIVNRGIKNGGQPIVINDDNCNRKIF